MERLSLSDAVIKAEAFGGRAAVLPGSRYALVRRAEAYLTWPLLRRQLKYNLAVVEALRQLKAGLDAVSSGGGASRQEYASHHEGIAALRRDMVALQQEAAELRSYVDQIAGAARSGQAHLDLFLDQVRRALPEAPAREQLAELPTAWESLYTAFEDTYRGPVAEIEARCRPYLADLPDPEAVPAGAPVCDLGAGRGEWLTVLAGAGRPAYGIDSNEVAVRRARESLGVDVRVGDVLAHLRDVPERSLAAVTALHLVEHIEVAPLIELLDLALRSLAPGGRLILETPNPDNLVVGAASFHLDPTHLRPLPPALLEFLVTARGFADVEVRLLPRAAPPLAEPEEPGPLRDVVQLLNSHLGAAQDYAVLATRR